MKFGWISDSHLGYVQYGLDRRRLDFERAFESAVDAMLMGFDLKLIVHTGDLLNSNRPGPDAIECLRRVHRKLIENRARMVVISGNHDYTDPPWPTLLEPDPDMLGITVQDHQVFTYESVRFFCLPYVPVERFKQLVWPAADILLCHQQIREFIGFESLNALSVTELPIQNYRAILVGDIHKTQIERYQNEGLEHAVPVGYIGSMELCSESEPSVKYWAEVDVGDDKGPIQITKYEIPTRLVVRVSLKKPEDLDPAVEMVRRAYEQAVEHLDDTREPIVFVEYPSTMTDVMDRFKKTFNPDQFILRFKSRLVLGAPTSVPLPPQEQELTPVDILRSKLALRGDLLPVAEQLINKDVDANAAADQFIEARLRAIEADTRPVDRGASAVS